MTMMHMYVLILMPLNCSENAWGAAPLKLCAPRMQISSIGSLATAAKQVAKGDIDPREFRLLAGYSGTPV